MKVIEHQKSYSQTDLLVVSCCLNGSNFSYNCRLILHLKNCIASAILYLDFYIDNRPTFKILQKFDYAVEFIYKFSMHYTFS